MACLVLTSRLSGLNRTHYWVKDDEKNMLFELKKKISPAADTLIGNHLERRAGLRRPTESGLNCDRRTHPERVLHSHHVYLICSGLSFKSKMMKNGVFSNSLFDTPKKVGCMPSLRGRTQSLTSLLNTVTCPSRCPMTGIVPTSRLSDLKRTHD